MKNGLNVISGLVLISLAIYFYKIVLIGIVILIVLIIGFVSIEYEIRQRRLARFLAENNGKYYLRYGSNKRLKKVIENDLLFTLPMQYGIIYTNIPQSAYLTKEALDYLIIQSGNIKFPVLLKISDNKLITESFFVEVNELKRGLISKTEFENKVLLKLTKFNDEHS